MRRKVIQDFANVFCQRFIDLPSGYDLATFANLRSGTASLDILSGECVFSGVPIRHLHTCDENRTWLDEQCRKHGIPFAGIVKAVMTITVDVTDIVVKTSSWDTSRSARFAFECQSQIATDEKVYEGRAAGHKVWGFAYYWEKLYGSAEHA